MGSLDWAVIAPGAAGGVLALVVVAAAATRRQRRTELAELTARDRDRLPARRIEVVAIDHANPAPDPSTIERK